MKRWFGLALGAALIPALMAGGPQDRAYAQNSAAKLQAQRAAGQWLALVDAGEYGESYDRAAQSFKSAVTRAQWIQAVTAARGTLGKLVSRRLTRAAETKNPPSGPPGDYMVLQYQSSFANTKSALETVVPVFEKDGKWRVSTYTVK